MATQTVLVTGGCGYIGSHVTRQLSERGIKVVVIDNLSSGFREALLHDETFYEVDLADAAGVDAVFSKHKFDAVLHFAAFVSVPESVADPLKYYRNNTFNAANLMGAATRHGVQRFIFSSTAAAYGQPKKMPVMETDPSAPESPYGHSKLMSEQILKDTAAATGLRFVILRYFNVAGADPQTRIGQRTPNATHLIKVACEVAVGKRKELTVYGTDYPTRDGTCIRDYIHVEDLAGAHLSALDYLERGGANILLNCGYGHGSTVKEVVQTVKDVSGIDFPVTMGPRRPGDVTEVVAGADRIRQALGWQPRLDNLRTIVEHAYRFEQKISGKLK